ncbi:MAG: CPBP family intramembrane glutamic endopeptidase [Ktedonobacterales bacterium]
MEAYLSAAPAAAPDARYTNGRIALYLALAFGLAWLLELGLLLTGTSPAGGGVRFTLVAQAVMLCPAIATVITLRGPKRGFGDAGLRPLFKRSWRYYLVAFLLPVGITAVATALTLLLGQARLDFTLPALRPLLHGAPVTPALTAAVVAQTVVEGSLIGTLLGMGEELGWRGYLLPALLRRGLSLHAAFIVSGIIWGLWHAPLILMGYNYPHTPVLGVAMFCVFTVLATYVLGWLRLASGTTWTAALGHSAIDQSASGAGLLLAPGSYNTSIGTVVGPIGWLPLAAVTLWLIVTGRIRRLKV